MMKTESVGKLGEGSTSEYGDDGTDRKMAQIQQPNAEDRPSEESCYRLSRVKQCRSSTTRDKIHRCEECSKQFSQLGHLKTHMRTHTREKPYRCEECSRKFSTLGSRKTHMRTHTGEKPYKCEECSKQFIVLGSLKAHMRTHTGETVQV